MKKRVLGTLICSMFLFGASTAVVKSVEAQDTLTNVGDKTYHCTASPNPALNKGNCAAMGGGNNQCFAPGVTSGPACNGTLEL